MKPEPERAIHTLDELITWLASKGIIKNQAALDRVASALKVVAENCEHDDGGAEAQINALATLANKYRLMLLASGFTNWGINDLAKIEEHDLEDFIRGLDRSENSKPLYFPLAIEMLKTNIRVRKLLELEHLPENQWI